MKTPMSRLIPTTALLFLLMASCSTSSSGPENQTDTLADVTADTAEDGTVEADQSQGEDGASKEIADEDIAEVRDNPALLFPHNPVKDEWIPQEVSLSNIDDEAGGMTGPYANVFNCLNEDGGWTRDYDIPMLGPVHVQLCNIKKTVFPDDAGSYEHVTVPTDLLDPSDSFAEMMLFYHMNFIHDYYKQVHGFSGMDFPLEGYVNLQGYLEMENPLDGIPEGWVTFDNAMFIPKESLEMIEELGAELLAQYLGVDDKLDLPFKNDAILFLQGEALDFAYDADVIYHEYTHAVVGGDRLFGYGIDEFGPDAAPTSINEAYADYFSCSVMGDPVVSEYALETLGAGRDVSQMFHCPTDYFGESHQDGQIYSSALWAIREALGQEDSDLIIFNALLTFQNDTCFQEAAMATIAEAALLDPPKDTEVEAIFEERGILGCNGRVKPYADKTEGFPDIVPGTQTLGVDVFAEAAPGFTQYQFEVEEGTQSLVIEVQAETGLGIPFLEDFLGPMPVELSAAFSPDGPIQFIYEPEFSHNALGVLPFEEVEDGILRLTVAGSCLTPGTWYFQFWNRSASDATIRQIVMTQSTQPATEANFNCDEEPPE